MPASWTILTPPTATGAIAIIQVSSISAASMDAALNALGLCPLATGAAKLANLVGVDTGMAVRWSDTTCHLMPHGGVVSVRRIARALSDRGLKHEASPSAPAIFTEGASLLECRMLDTVSRAASPLAVDLLLDQPRRWAQRADTDPALDRVLHRLVRPPLVAALGPANVGKSTLVNTLAGREVSIVADEPGTTRDHVGVALNLGGLVVRYLDTPGIRRTSDAIEHQALQAAWQAASPADLVLLLGDARSPPPDLTVPAPTIRVALRIDLGRPPWPADLHVSARTGEGTAELVAAIREALIPRSALEDPRPWRFWEDPASPRAGATGPSPDHEHPAA